MGPGINRGQTPINLIAAAVMLILLTAAAFLLVENRPAVYGAGGGGGSQADPSITRHIMLGAGRICGCTLLCPPVSRSFQIPGSHLQQESSKSCWMPCQGEAGSVLPILQLTGPGHTLQRWLPEGISRAKTYILTGKAMTGVISSWRTIKKPRSLGLPHRPTCCRSDKLPLWGLTPITSLNKIKYFQKQWVFNA